MVEIIKNIGSALSGAGKTLGEIASGAAKTVGSAALKTAEIAFLTPNLSDSARELKGFVAKKIGKEEEWQTQKIGVEKFLKKKLGFDWADYTRTESGKDKVCILIPRAFLSTDEISELEAYKNSSNGELDKQKYEKNKLCKLYDILNAIDKETQNKIGDIEIVTAGGKYTKKVVITINSDCSREEFKRRVENALEAFGINSPASAEEATERLWKDNAVIFPSPLKGPTPSQNTPSTQPESTNPVIQTANPFQSTEERVPHNRSAAFGFTPPTNQPEKPDELTNPVPFNIFSEDLGLQMAKEEIVPQIEPSVAVVFTPPTDQPKPKPVMQDGGTQTDNPSRSIETQTDNPKTYADMGTDPMPDPDTQTPKPAMQEGGTQTDNPSRSIETQTDNPKKSTGVGTDPMPGPDTQTPKPDMKEGGTQTDNPKTYADTGTDPMPGPDTQPKPSIKPAMTHSWTQTQDGNTYNFNFNFFYFMPNMYPQTPKVGEAGKVQDVGIDDDTVKTKTRDVSTQTVVNPITDASTGDNISTDTVDSTISQEKAGDPEPAATPIEAQEAVEPAEPVVKQAKPVEPRQNSQDIKRNQELALRMIGSLLNRLGENLPEQEVAGKLSKANEFFKELAKNLSKQNSELTETDIKQVAEKVGFEISSFPGILQSVNDTAEQQSDAKDKINRIEANLKELPTLLNMMYSGGHEKDAKQTVDPITIDPITTQETETREKISEKEGLGDLDDNTLKDIKNLFENELIAELKEVNSIEAQEVVAQEVVAQVVEQAKTLKNVIRQNIQGSQELALRMKRSILQRIEETILSISIVEGTDASLKEDATSLVGKLSKANEFFNKLVEKLAAQNSENATLTETDIRNAAKEVGFQISSFPRILQSVNDIYKKAEQQNSHQELHKTYSRDAEYKIGTIINLMPKVPILRDMMYSGKDVKQAQATETLGKDAKQIQQATETLGRDDAEQTIKTLGKKDSVFSEALLKASLNLNVLQDCANPDSTIGFNNNQQPPKGRTR